MIINRTSVLHLITHLGVGGAQDNTLLTVRNLNRARYAVHLAAGSDERAWLERGRAWSDGLSVLPALRRAVEPVADARALQQLVALFRQVRPAIVHTHSSKAGLLGRIAAQIARVPLVVHTVHGFAWTPAQPSAVQRAYQLLERWLARHTHALITVAERNRQTLLDLAIAAPERITTIYSGIEVERFAAPVDRAQVCRTLGLDAAQPIVGYVARLCPQKAPLDFVAAARLVAARFPQAQFVMIGDGPLAASVAAQTRTCANIHLVGQREDVADLVGAFDVFALSSHWEGLGRALTEAMLAGVPVAATAVDGVPELVLHAETGLLSPVANPALLAENIARLLADPALAQRIGRAGAAHTRQRFGATAMVEQIDALYQRLLNEQQAHSKE